MPIRLKWICKMTIIFGSEFPSFQLQKFLLRLTAMSKHYSAANITLSAYKVFKHLRQKLNAPHHKF